MATWGQILNEIQTDYQQGDFSVFERVRNKYISLLANFTGRDTIIYASKWTSNDAPPHLVSINDEDIHAFMEVLSGLQGTNLDLILHSGGGSAEATDAIVSYLRQKYNHVRVIIPQAAMSAGTMLACSADAIVMGKQSSIGPIDPQFILQTSVGIQVLPAYAILEQFKMAQDDCAKNPKNLNSWVPMLSQYGPALLVRCKDQIDFGEELVKGWLSAYMFKEDKNKINKSDRISKYLSDHSNFKTHSKHINIDNARKIGLNIEQLENNQEFQDKVLSAFHATMHLLSITNAAKIVANQKGNNFIKFVYPTQHK